MVRKSLTETLKCFCSLPGISGQEQMVAKVIAQELTERGIRAEVDRMGNVSAVIRGRGNAPSVMLMAHMDEVGAIVSEICDNGLLLFKTVGCVDPGSLPAVRVNVNGIPGAVGAPPAHMAGSAGGAPSRLYIDVGAESRGEVDAMGISIGSMVTFDTPFTRFGRHRVCGHALDDRVGCAMLLHLLDQLDFQPDGDLILGFSVREETTMAGAGMLVDRCRPDCVVAVDTVPMRMSGGTPLIDLGKGPVFQLAEGVMSAYVGSFVHSGVKQALLQAAAEADASYQLCAEVGDWTTDGDAISRANGGTPGAYLSIPRRSAHCASEVMDLRDPQNGIRILYFLIKNMKEINLNFI